MPTAELMHAAIVVRWGGLCWGVMPGRSLCCASWASSRHRLLTISQTASPQTAAAGGAGAGAADGDADGSSQDSLGA